MTHSPLLSLAAALPCVAALAVAAPPPKPTVRAITAENAHRVRQVSEVEKRAYRILRGPKRGELTLLDWDNGAEVVDDTQLRTLRTVFKGHRPTDLAMSPGGKYRAWVEGDKPSYKLEDTDAGKTIDVEVGDSAGYAAISPDGKLLAIGKTYWDPRAHGAGHSEVNLYDTAGTLLRTLAKTGPGAVKPLFTPDGKTLAVGNRNYETRLFDAGTGKLLHTLDKRMTQEIAFSPDGKKLAAGYVDGTVRLWDVATGKMLHDAPSGCKEVYSVDWSPKGDLLAWSGRDGKIVLWDPATFAKRKELDAPFWVIQIRFTADGGRLITASASEHTAKNDRKLIVWAVPPGVK